MTPQHVVWSEPCKHWLAVTWPLAGLCPYDPCPGTSQCPFQILIQGHYWRSFMVLESDPLNCLCYTLYCRDVKEKEEKRSQKVRARWIKQWKMKGRKNTKIKKVKGHCIYSTVWGTDFQYFPVLFHITLLIKTTSLLKIVLPFSYLQLNKNLKIIRSAAVLKENQPNTGHILISLVI